MGQDLRDVIIHVDKSKLDHLMRILLNNAIDAAPPQTIITINVELIKNMASLLHSYNKYLLKIVISYIGVHDVC